MITNIINNKAKKAMQPLFAGLLTCSSVNVLASLSAYLSNASLAEICKLCIVGESIADSIILVSESEILFN